MIGIVPVAVLVAGAVPGHAAARHGGPDAAVDRAAGYAEPLRGSVVAMDAIASVSVEQARARLAELGIDTAAAQFGFDAVRLAYRTINPAGRATTASALLAVPVGAPGPRAIASYGHGTITDRTDSPSAFGVQEAQPVAALFASRGFYLLAPDYLGWGTGRGTHPYLHARSEASTMRDALIATRSWLTQQRRPVRQRTFATGFSQGGQAALALTEDLTRRPVAGLRLAATAGAAGPYDMSATQVPAMIDPTQVDPASVVTYTALLLTSYDRLYDLYRHPSEVFAAPYDRTVTELLDGTHSGEEIAAGLPDDPAALLTRKWQAQLRRPSGRFLAALRANDTCSFRTATPIRLYTSAADRDVPASNSKICRQRLRAQGGQAQVITVGDVAHSPSAVLALPKIADWFAHLS